jgi:hypothetical protein
MLGSESGTGGEMRGNSTVSSAKGLHLQELGGGRSSSSSMATSD